MMKWLLSEERASPLWLARRRIVVCSLLLEACLIVAIVVHGMLYIATNPMLGDALDALLYLFAATVLGYTGLATWGDRNDAKFSRRREDNHHGDQHDAENGSG